ncbi:hypothetical protein BC828DRAFT_394961 [Blastocladiella britannica]|nr:hypothetical protein BC828DRAFT_394961 [Blastocladiella britannica]
MVSILALIALVVVLMATGADAQCRVRKELRSLSSGERAAMVRGFNSMYSSGRLEQYRRTHEQNLGFAHGTNNFLLWHRSFLMNFESDFLSAAGGGISGLPYHDLSSDASNPAGSSVWSSSLMGNDNGCSGAPFNGMQVNGQCLNRGGPNGNWGGCAGSVVSGLINRNTEYTQFTRSLEGICHNQVHSSFPGSPLYYMNQSPSDPYFYPFHVGIDHMFATWQLQNGQANIDWNARIYAGRTANELFSYTSGGGCYSYQDINGPPPQPSSTSTPAPPTTATTATTASSSATNTGASTTDTTTATSTTASGSTAAPQPTGKGTGGTIGNTDPSWVPPFVELPAEFFKDMGFNQSQIDGFNREFKTIVTFLNKTKETGGKIPTLDDFSRISGSNKTDTVAPAADAKKPSSATGLSVAFSAALGLVALLVTML